MNRTTALVLALAALLAHSLAIHDTADGEFAAPFDQAHVAYRVARNLVYHGDPAWTPGVDAPEPYPSWTWIAVCAGAEQFYLGPNRATQALGILSALATVVVLAQFSPKRLAGVIAPLLLVVSGGMASAAAGGTESAFFALLVTACFLAFERRRPLALAALYLAACLTRPETILFVAGLALLEVLRGRTPPASGGSGANDPDRVPSLAAALAPHAFGALAWVGMGLVRMLVWGHFQSAPIAALLDPDQVRWKLGISYLSDFFLLAGGPTLVIFPLLCLPFRKLDGVGLRALFLSLLWCAMVARQGGDSRPLWGAMVPVLPLLFLSIQSGMTGIMDTRGPGLEPATWLCFLGALLLSALESKHPGDVGPLPLDRMLRAWNRPNVEVERAYERQYGRQGLRVEILAAERLRSIGIFFRDQVEPSATILTPWPGAIGYLSRKDVIDLLGRVNPPPDAGEPVPWDGHPRVDIVETLGRMPDYVVASLSAGRRPPLVRELIEEWLSTWDSVGDTAERRSALIKVLRRFELVSAPVPIRSDRPDDPTGPPVYLLRKRSLGLAPRLVLEVRDGEFTVSVYHAGHHQLVDLDVRLTDDRGRMWSLRPTGVFDLEAAAHARTEILLYATGSRPVQLFRARLPDDVGGVELSAVLRNPGSQHELDFSAVSNREAVRLSR